MHDFLACLVPKKKTKPMGSKTCCNLIGPRFESRLSLHRSSRAKLRSKRDDGNGEDDEDEKDDEDEATKTRPMRSRTTRTRRTKKRAGNNDEYEHDHVEI